MIFVLFLISVGVMEVILHSGQKRRRPSMPVAKAESSGTVGADLLALSDALKAASPNAVEVRQPEYNETDARAE